jgi:hypothetical protein
MLDHLAVPEAAKTGMLDPMVAKTSGMWMLG